MVAENPIKGTKLTIYRKVQLEQFKDQTGLEYLGMSMEPKDSAFSCPMCGKMDCVCDENTRRK